MSALFHVLEVQKNGQLIKVLIKKYVNECVSACGGGAKRNQSVYAEKIHARGLQQGQHIKRGM